MARDDGYTRTHGLGKAEFDAEGKPLYRDGYCRIHNPGKVVVFDAIPDLGIAGGVFPPGDTVVACRKWDGHYKPRAEGKGLKDMGPAHPLALDTAKRDGKDGK